MVLADYLLSATLTRNPVLGHPGTLSGRAFLGGSLLGEATHIQSHRKRYRGDMRKTR